MTHLIQLHHLHQWLVVRSRSLAIVLLSLSVTIACGGAEPMMQEEDPNEGLTADLVQRMLPNPTGEVITQWAALPDGRSWGSTAGIDIGPDGHIWVYDRCGANGLDGGCEANPEVDPILKYDRNTAELLANFGAGLFVLPHGLHVDADGNVWVTDSQGNEAGTKGHQVIKFSPEGEVLLTLGEAGQPGTGPGQLNEPCDVITAPNGDIFVSDGHSGQGADPPEGRTGRILKFDSEGNFIKEWGEIGFRPGQFRTPHALEFDSQGRLYVADRGNHRIQVFDQEGELLEIYTQFSRVSGLFITDDDTLYAIDSESVETNHYGWMNGVRIGPAGADRVTGFIPPHVPAEGRVLQGLAGEGIAVDADGNVFVAEGPASRPFAGGGLTKYAVK
jgi:DNA-binding beta-propeller fold protein YncE